MNLDHAGSFMCGDILGIAARPLIEALMQIARALRANAGWLLRPWIICRWD